MNTTTRRACVILGLLLAGCGGGSGEGTGDGQDEASSGGEAEHHHHGEGHGGHHEHAELPPSVSAFHDVLAPAFHADPGPGRAQAACDAHETFDTRAAAVRDDAAPEGADADAYAHAAAGLVAASAELTRVCGEGTDGAEAALDSLHDAFHAVVEQLGAS
jgi:hypothetical protein